MIEHKASITLQCLSASVITLVLIISLLPLAYRLQLVDKPDQQRKIHDGTVPLLGGIAIYLGIFASFFLFHTLTTSLASFFVASGILVAVGAVDDRFGLKVRFRILIEIIAACVMIFGAGLWVGNLGNLLGFGSVHLPFLLGIPFTLVAVFGILNALNMIDGIDGVAGGIALISITLLFWNTSNSKDLQVLGPLLGGAITAYLACNLQISRRLPKIFLGDAGSKLLGLSLVWFLIEVAKSGSAKTGGIEPATALYAVALPLFDMVSVTVRRAKKGVSPFSPDKTHIHHLFLRAGFSKRVTITIILGIALLLNLTGLILNQFEIPELPQFALFFGLYLLYTYNIQRVFKLAIKARKLLAASMAPRS